MALWEARHVEFSAVSPFQLAATTTITRQSLAEGQSESLLRQFVLEDSKFA